MPALLCPLEQAERPDDDDRPDGHAGRAISLKAIHQTGPRWKCSIASECPGFREPSTSLEVHAKASSVALARILMVRRISISLAGLGLQPRNFVVDCPVERGLYAQCQVVMDGCVRAIAENSVDPCLRRADQTRDRMARARLPSGLRNFQVD
jgi:hypothetical protein